MFGAGLGFFAGLWAMVAWARNHTGPKGVLVLFAAMFFGALVGLDLHSTRRWRAFGRYTIAVRLGLASSSGGALTALAGVVVGMVSKADIWQFALVGAVLGFGVGLRIVWDNRGQSGSFLTDR